VRPALFSSLNKNQKPPGLEQEGQRVLDLRARAT
jgi:hypothetical protein